MLVMAAPGVGTGTAAAQDLTIVAPAAPGGGWDQTARALQRAFAATTPPVSVQVENVPGAAGTIGLARFASADRGRADALLVTGLVMVSGIVATHSVVSLADVTPIARLTGEHEVIVVPADSPHRTLQDLLAAFRAAPRSVSWGGGSAGGTDDLLARLMAEAIGVPPADVNYVAFSGGGEALAALLGGQITAGVSGLGEFAPSITSGQLRALAISAPARVPDLDAPTLREAGVPLDLANWRAVVAPPGVSDAEAAALTARVRAAVTSTAWRDTLARTGWTDLYQDGPAFRQFLLAEQARVNAVLARLAQGGPAAAATWTPTATTSPALAVALAIVLALLHAWQRRGVATGGVAPGGLARVALITGATLAHALLQPLTGFIPTATLLFAAGAAAMGQTRPLRAIAVGAAVTIVIAVVFAAGLGVPLPMGAWTR
ncbi:MAG: tripartite tricarboxylate transporter TctB family protein [Acidobacteria bacterium]|nr:tripartite tricarboxylate transporter TctB family protein [Acidobacteriota bacterium]